MREDVEPTVTPLEPPNNGVRLDHPAYGMIAVSRMSGNSGALFGSDFEHHATIRLEINTATLERHLSNDWYHPRKDIVTVYMSEAQWATFVSSFGVGSGVPCTIRSRDGEYLPGFPLRDSTKHFKPEAESRLSHSVSSLERLMNDLEAGLAGVPKGKAAAILAHVQRAHQELKSNIPFVMQQMGEHMETLVEKAKVEVNAYVTSTVIRAGLDALGIEGKPIAMITGPSSEPDSAS